MYLKTLVLRVLPLIVLLGGCYSEDSLFEYEDGLKSSTGNSYETENVIVVTVDGVRQSETWQSLDRKYIPKMDKELAPQGIVISEFYNHGVTFTVPGHVAIATGNYESLPNNGKQKPSQPSFLQMWLKAADAPKEKAWIVTSKAKLEVLADCNDLAWHNSYTPSVDAVSREDEQTYQRAIEILTEYQPQLVLLHFGGPDIYGHTGNWDNYVNSIAIADSLVAELWNFIETNDIYKGKTTMIVTNDHGRHLDNIASGFSVHGDHCLGCTHINFYAAGPDFKEGQISTIEREQTDILPTVGELMGFQYEKNTNVMWELFK